MKVTKRLQAKCLIWSQDGRDALVIFTENPTRKKENKGSGCVVSLLTKLT